jgi:hypothetical protein
MEATNEIAAALAKAQAEMSNPAFDSNNPHFKSKFASLAAVRNAVIPVLARNGIACLQDIKNEGAAISCTTILAHSSGQRFVLGPLVIPATKPDAQGLGSAETYARRYALMAAAGVVGDSDDDAEGAVGRNGNGAALPTELISQGQSAHLTTLIKETGADSDKFLAYMKLKTLGEMRASDFDRAVSALNKKRGA